MPEKKPFEMELHGDVRVDDYYWLRERENPEVIAYLNAENAYTEKMMVPIKGIQTILFDEIRSRMKEDEESAPYKRGDYYYYYRYVEGSEYPIYARKKGSLDADEQILLDVNQLAGDANASTSTSESRESDSYLAGEFRAWAAALDATDEETGGTL